MEPNLDMRVLRPPESQESSLSAQVELRVRRLLWLLHGHVELCTDDKKMGCAACLLDYSSAPLHEIVEQLDTLAGLDPRWMGARCDIASGVTQNWP